MKSTTVDLSMHWYISTKPYSNYDDYDWYYLNLLKEIYGFLNKKEFREYFFISTLDVRDLAFCLTGYFEDIINESGIWLALVTKHRKLYNKPLPFIKTVDPDYADGDLNIEDIVFLIWYFTSQNSNGDIIYSINDPIINTLSLSLYELFENHYDQAYATEYYNEYFTINEVDDYFMVREKIHWLAFQSFLIGAELSQYHEDLIHEFIEKGEDLGDTERVLAYAIPIVNDEAIYKKATRYSAFRAIEIFAEIVRAPDTCKETLLNLTNKHYGLYKYLEDNGKYVVFENLSTHNKYNVLLDSFGSLEGIMEESVSLTGFIKWNGEWLLSGNIVSFDNTEKEQKKWIFDNQNLLYNYDEKYRQDVLDVQKENYNDFLEFFNESYVFINSYQQLEQKVKDYYQYVNDKRSKATGLETKILDRSFNNLNLPKDLQDLDDYCIYFNPDSGIEFVFHIKEVLKEIKRLDLKSNNDDRFFIFDFLFSDATTAQFILELKNKYDLSNIKHLFSMDEFDINSDLEFVLRFFKPFDFIDKNPNISLYDSSQNPSIDSLRIV